MNTKSKLIYHGSYLEIEFPDIRLIEPFRKLEGVGSCISDFILSFW